MATSGWQAADQEWPLFVLAGFFAAFWQRGAKWPPYDRPLPAQPSAVSSRKRNGTLRGPADFPSRDLGEELLPRVSSGMAFALNFASTKFSAAVLFRGPA